jgi:hypothetical protein
LARESRNAVADLQRGRVLVSYVTDNWSFDPFVIVVSSRRS